MSILGGKACVQRKEVEFEAEYLSKKIHKTPSWKSTCKNGIGI